MKTKICNTCKKELPETSEYFLRYWSKEQQKYYFKGHCLDCGKAKSKAWRENNRKRYVEYYTERAKSEKGREYDKRWKKENADKVKEQKKKYRAENKEKIQAYDKNRRTDKKTRETVLQQCRNWKASNKERVKAYNQKYAAEHPEYFRAAAKRRATLTKALVKTLTPEEWENAKLYFGGCAYCGKQLKKLTKDHFIPLSKGGTYTAENILPSCRSCNSSKSNKSFEEWYKTFSHYSIEREKRIKDYIINMATPR